MDTSLRRYDSGRCPLWIKPDMPPGIPTRERGNEYKRLPIIERTNRPLSCHSREGGNPVLKFQGHSSLKNLSNLFNLRINIFLAKRWIPRESGDPSPATSPGMQPFPSLHPPLLHHLAGILEHKHLQIFSLTLTSSYLSLHSPSFLLFLGTGILFETFNHQ